MSKETHAIKDLNKLKFMYDFLRKHGHNREAFILIIGCNVALRISDLLNLQFNDIKNNKVQLIEKKTKKHKTLKLNTEVIKYIDDLKAWYKSNGYEPIFLFESTSHNSKGNLRKHVSPSWVIRKFKEAAEAAMIDENIGTHSMRKTYGYHAHKKGTPIEMLQKIFNHSSPAVTLRYIGITQENIDDCYEHNAIRI